MQQGTDTSVLPKFLGKQCMNFLATVSCKQQNLFFCQLAFQSGHSIYMPLLNM